MSEEREITEPTLSHLWQIAGWCALEGMDPKEITLAEAVQCFDMSTHQLKPNSFEQDGGR